MPAMAGIATQGNKINNILNAIDSLVAKSDIAVAAALSNLREMTQARRNDTYSQVDVIMSNSDHHNHAATATWLKFATTPGSNDHIGTTENGK